MAAGGKGVRAGKAFVELGVDSKIAKGLRRASARLRAFGAGVEQIGAGMARLGAVAGAAMFAAARTFATMGDRIAKMAKRTGLSVEALSELDFVASQTGTSIQGLENGLRRMQRTIYDASRGLSTAVDGLADMGLTLRDLEGLTPERQFKLMADSLSQIEDPTRRAALAMTILGRSGTALLPMMEKGAAGIERLQQQARQLGLTMSTEDAVAAERFTDEMDALWRIVKMGVFKAVGELIPTLAGLVESFRQNVARVVAFVRRNRELVITVAKATLKVGALGLALIVLAKGFYAVAVAMKVVAVSTKVLGAAFSFLLAHPVVAVLALIVTAAIAAVYAIKQLTQQTAKLREGGEKLRAAGKERRRQEELQIETLARLAEKQELTNKEMAEAKGIIRSLERQYADLGIAIDRTTGKITGLTAAQAKMADATQTDEVIELDNVISDLQYNINRLRKEQQTLFAGRFRKGRIAGIGREIADLQSILAGAMLERRDLTTGKAGPDPALAAARKLAAEQAGARAEPEIAREVHRLKLQQLEDHRKRALALLNEEYDHKVSLAEKAAKNQATIDLIVEARRLKVLAIERRFDQQAAEERRRNEEDLARKKRAAEDRLGAIREADAARHRTIQELELQAKYKGVELERRLLELRRRYALQEAKAAGERVDQVDREFNLRRKLLDAGEAAAAAGKATTAARGTFYAASIRGLLTAGSAADRTANATEETARNTAKLIRAQGAGATFA